MDRRSIIDAAAYRVTKARNQNFFGGGGVENLSERDLWGTGEGLGEGGIPLPEQGKFCIWSLKRTVSDAYFEQRLLKYDFLQNRQRGR